MNSNDWNTYFDELKEKEGLSNDSALAKSLEVSRGYISAIRCGRKSVVSTKLGLEILKRLNYTLDDVDKSLFTPENIKTKLNSQHFIRDPSVAAYAKNRANGYCELCGIAAPFITKQGHPYLEAHHLLPISMNGKDSIDNVVALCPNCNRKMSLAVETSDLIKLAKVLDIKENNLKKIKDLLAS